MGGKLLEDIISRQIETFRREWVLVPLFGLSGLMVAGGAVSPWLVSREFPSFLIYSLPGAFLILGGGIALFFLSRSSRYGAIFFLIAGIIASGFFYTQRVIFPLVNPLKSARFISQEVTSRIQPGERLGIYGEGTGPYNFYTGIVPIIELERKKELHLFLKSDGRVFCLMKAEDYSSLVARERDLTIHVIARRQVGGSEMVLVSNR